jgi:hypothetical protein
MPYEYDPKTEDAIAKDRALQADPELELGSGRASTAQIALTAVASFAIITLVIYGLTHQRDETAATEPAQVTAQGPDQPAAPPASGQASQGERAQNQQNAQTQGQKTQGQNQPANSAPKQNAPQGETTGSGGKTTSGSPATGRGDSSQQGAPVQANSPTQKK